MIMLSKDRFRSKVIEDAVHALDLVDDAVCDVLQELEGDVLNRGGHGVLGVDGTDDHRPVPAALAVNHAC